MNPMSKPFSPLQLVVVVHAGVIQDRKRGYVGFETSATVIPFDSRRRHRASKRDANEQATRRQWLGDGALHGDAAAAAAAAAAAR
jgi:hypothetical protein